MNAVAKPLQKAKTAQLFVRTVHGFDPYNTLDHRIADARFIRSFSGPLNPVAYRDQKRWDFAHGDGADAKLVNYRPAQGSHQS